MVSFPSMVNRRTQTPPRKKRTTVSLFLSALLICFSTSSGTSAQMEDNAPGKLAKSMKKQVTEYYQKREYAKVVSLLVQEKLSGESQDDIDCLLMLGQSYYAQKDIDRALNTFCKYLALKPSPQFQNATKLVDQDLAIIADVHAKHGRISKAEELYFGALSKVDQGSIVHMRTQAGLARMYMKSKSYDKAETLLRKLLKQAEEEHDALHPDSIGLRQGLAYCLLRENKKPEAESLFSSIVHSCEKSGDESDLANALTHLAQFYLIAGEFPKAEAPLQRALSIRRKINASMFFIGRTLENLQIIFERSGMRSKIVSLFEETTNQELPDSPEIEKKRAVIYARAGELGKAIDNLAKLSAYLEKSGIDSHFEQSNVNYCLGQLQVLSKDYEHALVSFERLERNFPTSAITYKIEMISPQEAVKAAESNDDFLQITRDLDRLPRNCDYLGALYARLGQFSRAEKLYEDNLEKKLKNDPDCLERLRYQSALAWLFFADGKQSEALDVLSKAIDYTRTRRSYEVMDEKILLEGNKAFVLEKNSLEDAEAQMRKVLQDIETGEYVFFLDPVPELGEIDDEALYGSGNYDPPGTYKNSADKKRFEPVFSRGWPGPSLVLYKGGKLGVEDLSLFPNENPRKDFIDPWQHRKHMAFLDWSYRFWEWRGDQLRPLAETRIADLCAKQGKYQEAESLYDQAIEHAKNDYCWGDVQAVIFRQKASFMRSRNKIVEANDLEKQASEVLLDFDNTFIGAW